MKRIVDDGENDKSIHVLVAEDDSFQRLSLIDILTLCNYEVTAVENGRLARDELLKENSYFDVVLLDLMMPEMHGFELLCLMQANEKLKNIPVIMMSSDGERDIVAACLSKGAKDYLVKPLRITMVRGIAKHVVANPQGNNSSEKVQYKKLNVLGQGAAGSVELVQRTDNGELYALKVIPLHFMSQQEKKLAESEVTLLKVLVAPTIIRYYDSFVESDSICIVMEYAKAGSLFEKIQEKRTKGERLTDDQVLYYIAQLVIAVMFMHSKNILHRDIKTQNMFLTSENIVKLGDFGIAKALGTNADMTKTLVGTPYFMSPEVCKGEQYGQKADIWAIGCTLYELIMLRRPFEDNTISVLFDKIQNINPEPIDDDYIGDTKMLVQALLNKDPNSRPSVWEIAQMPCISKLINKYYQEEAPEDAFLAGIIEQHNNFKVKNPLESQTDMLKPQEKESQSQPINTQQKEFKTNGNTQQKPVQSINKELFQMAKSLRSGLTTIGISTGMMSYEPYLVKGEDLKKWFKDHYPGGQKGDSEKYIQEMIDMHYLHIVIQKLTVSETLYRFQRDIPGIPANCFYIMHEQSKGIYENLTEIIDLANQVLKEIVDSGNGNSINTEKLNNSKKFIKFEENVCELQLLNFKSIEEEEKYPILLDLLQIMEFHQYLREKLNKKLGLNFNIKAHISIIGKIISFIPFIGPKQNPDLGVFQYKLNDISLTLSDLKHGILRNNQKPSYYTNFKTIQKSDLKYQLIKKLDYRILFLFREEQLVPRKLILLNNSNLDSELDKICKKMLNSHICYDNMENDLTIHKVFQIYQQDFNKDPKEVLDFIYKYVKNLGNKEEILEGIKDSQIYLQYEEDFE